MDEPLDEMYLKWLYNQVASVRQKNPARTFWSLMGQLYKKEFVYLIPNDDNRFEDGRDLRTEFIIEYNIDRDPEWMGFKCSFLEMLIALARRLSFETDAGVDEWFWIMMDNLDLTKHSDAYYRGDSQHIVSEILDRVIWRTYEPDGHGGLFPLNYPDQDQREIEIWFQQALYLMERE